MVVMVVMKVMVTVAVVMAATVLMVAPAMILVIEVVVVVLQQQQQLVHGLPPVRLHAGSPYARSSSSSSSAFSQTGREMTSTATPLGAYQSDCEVQRCQWQRMHASHLLTCTPAPHNAHTPTHARAHVPEALIHAEEGGVAGHLARERGPEAAPQEGRPLRRQARAQAVQRGHEHGAARALHAALRWGTCVGCKLPQYGPRRAARLPSA